MDRRDRRLGPRAHASGLSPDVQVVTYAKQDWVFEDLKAGKIAGVFGDGMRLAFWLAGSDSGRLLPLCGRSLYGAGISRHRACHRAAKDDPLLTRAFDYALHEISAKGTFAELYLRYFPVSFF